MKKKRIIILTGCFVCILFSVMVYNVIKYPITLKINSSQVTSARIEYYGDGISQEVKNKANIQQLVQTLNNVRFKECEDMSHIAPRSGVIVIELFDKDGDLVEQLHFYDWVYRAGKSKKQDGCYLFANPGIRLGNVYILCDELCGDPFDSLQYKWLYWLG